MGEDRTPPERRLTVSDAAQELGISAEAVRSRVKRGSLESVKEGRTVYVLLPTDQTRPNSDRTATGHAQTSVRTGTRGGAQEELVESLLDQVAYMREQLAEEREARRRADTIIAQLTQANATLAGRVPEIEAPRDPSEAPEATRRHETAEEEPYSTHAPPQPERPVQRLSERVEEAMDRGEGVRTPEEPYGTSPQEAEDSLHRRSERSWWQRWFGAGGE